MNEIQLSTTDPTEIIAKYADILTEQQIQAAPLLSYGMSPKKVAAKLNVAYADLSSWLRDNAHLRNLINELKQQAAQYHKMMLNQAATMAWDRIFEFLDKPYEEDDKDNRNLQARLAQFIVGELGLREIKTTVEHIIPNLKVEENSLDILATKVAAIKEKKDAEIGVYRVADLQETDVAAQNRLYAISNKTQYGILSFDGQNPICHICGDATDDLILHLRQNHNMNAGKYRTMFELPPDTKLYYEGESS